MIKKCHYSNTSNFILFDFYSSKSNKRRRRRTTSSQTKQKHNQIREWKKFLLNENLEDSKTESDDDDPEYIPPLNLDDSTEMESDISEDELRDLEESLKQDLKLGMYGSKFIEIVYFAEGLFNKCLRKGRGQNGFTMRACLLTTGLGSRIA